MKSRKQYQTDKNMCPRIRKNYFVSDINLPISVFLEVFSRFMNVPNFKGEDF